MTLTRYALLLFALISGAGFAEPAFLPGLYAVSGVAADDTLNIRSRPDASSPVLGELPPGQAGLEVTGMDETGRWGRIGFGEVDGWVAMRYLAERPFPAGDIPEGMSCLGTEPFWNLRFAGDEAEYSDISGNWPVGNVSAAATRISPGRQTYGFIAEFPQDRLSGTVEAALCSDGMSDRTFGWRVILLAVGADDARLEHGCCTLARP